MAVSSGGPTRIRLVLCGVVSINVDFFVVVCVLWLLRRNWYRGGLLGVGNHGDVLFRRFRRPSWVCRVSNGVGFGLGRG